MTKLLILTMSTNKLLKGQNRDNVLKVIDEMTGVQALERKHPDLPMLPQVK
jgi:hypothetical protein